MQLVAGMKAEESLVDPVAGTWEPWKYGENPVLLAVAIGETEVRPVRANPDVLKHHWWKFCALRRVWELSADTIMPARRCCPSPRLRWRRYSPPRAGRRPARSACA